MQKIIFKFYHCNFIRISKVVIIWLCNINYKRDLEVFGAFAKQFPEWFTKIKFKWLHLFRGSRRGWLRLLCCMPIYSPLIGFGWSQEFLLLLWWPKSIKIISNIWHILFKRMPFILLFSVLSMNCVL